MTAPELRPGGGANDIGGGANLSPHGQPHAPI
jgi:hypothetical protein